MFSLIFVLHIEVMDLYCKILIWYQSTCFSLKFQEIQKISLEILTYKKQKICFIGVHMAKSLKYIYIYFHIKIKKMHLHTFLNLITSLLKP
jgi:hypothetical protein